MDDLEIKIAITYRIPRNNLTLNGLLRGLERDRDEIVALRLLAKPFFGVHVKMAFGLQNG